ncbi:MAG: hypothetical protein FWH03_04675 [Firmicutes bacterium]|nr:hypothetical protein [Bacillota bacterium]
MQKRIVSIILGIFIAAGLLAGCQFVEPNNFRDLRQVVAVVRPVEDVAFPDGNSGTRNIYKWQLLDALRQTYGNSTVAPTERDVDTTLNRLIAEEMQFIQIERMIHRDRLNRRLASEDTLCWCEDEDCEEEHVPPNTGGLLWRGPLNEDEDYDADTYFRKAGADDFDALVHIGYADFNKVKQMQYDSIDTDLRRIQREILERHGDEVPEEGGQEPPMPAPHPKPEPEELDEDPLPEELWDILREDPARIPGYFGSFDKRSLEERALREFTANITNKIEKEVKEFDEDKLEAAKKEYRDLIARGRYTELYLGLAKSYPVRFLTEEAVTRQVQAERLQEVLNQGITVSAGEVEARYDNLLRTQKLSFRNADTYSSAVSGGETILFRPNNRYSYVRHILVPFSDAQQARINSFKSLPRRPSRAEVEAFRNQQVQLIRHYPRIDGFEDFSSPMTAERIFNHVRRVVSEASSSLREAHRVFDELTYLYNTDPGAFSTPQGYALPTHRAANDARVYMEEFEDGARELFNNPKYSPGMVLDAPVITDYGMHIMFYASYTVANSEVQLNGFETPSEMRRIFEVLSDQIKEHKQSVRFNQWRDERVNPIMQSENTFETFKSRYRKLFE